MRRTDRIKRASSGAGLIVLFALIFTGNSPASHTDLGLLFVSSIPDGKLFSIHLPNMPPVPANQVERASGLPIAEGIACGPDGKVYVALSGFLNLGPRRIVRFTQTGAAPSELVLDFATTPALANSGGPEGPSFGLVAQPDGRLVPAGELFFNTRGNDVREGTILPHTGLWRLPALGVAPVQVIPPFTAPNIGAGATAFLTAGPFAGHLLTVDAFNGRVLRRAPPFTSAAAAVNFITGLSAEPLEVIGLAINSAGEVFVAEHTGRPTGNEGTFKIMKFASNGVPLGVFAETTHNPFKIAFDFDTPQNLYVATSGGPVLRFSQPSATQTAVGDVPGGLGVTVCPHRIPALIDIPIRVIRLSRTEEVEVAIVGTPFFDPATINRASIRFGAPSAVTAGGGTRPAGCELEKADDDHGRPERERERRNARERRTRTRGKEREQREPNLVCEFRVRDTGFKVGDIVAMIRWGNQGFEGLGSIEVLP